MIQVYHVVKYLVEYDLPADSRRLRFYRRINRYREDRGLDPTGWSTQSVVITESEAFAWELYRQARAVGGVAHVYEAKRLDVDP